ncbi:MAG: hypothetical protein M1821_006234 [Bathelium mastoideum]|nr:MAG: hypothetical protein M1821_006234 [Bathelium mastoideum]KAI9686573.1 MAG: hypothetical protein M1822_003584 [Bathelium mastoideum]
MNDSTRISGNWGFILDKREGAMRILHTLPLWISSSWALPRIALPFNSQVPPVARIGQNYEFRLSSSTFQSSSTILNYTLDGAPAWLALDSSTQTISGTPSQDDVGSPTFNITAVDDDGSTDMPVTLVVVGSPAPQAPLDVSEYLARDGTLAGPSCVSIHPNSAFHLGFPAGLFTDTETQELLYYATLVDHTPLPSWLSFNPNALAFSGITPGEASSPQGFNVELIASDVAGFAGAWINFTLLITDQRLAFNTSEQNISVASGRPLAYSALLSQLTLDSAPLSQSQIANATAQKPDWVDFDPTSLNITGNPPEGEIQENILVTVVDNAGDQASIILHLQGGDTTANSTFFSKQQGDINAAIGTSLDYDIAPSLFAKAGLNVSVDLGSVTPWLQFNETDLSIYGKIPSTVHPLVATATITARSLTSASSETETFRISVISASESLTLASRYPPAASATPTGNGQIAVSHATTTSKMPVGALIAISIIAAFIVAFSAFCLCRKARTKRKQGLAIRISRPMPEEAPPSAHDSKQEPDLEKNDSREQIGRAMTPNDPPQVALNLSQSRNSSRPRDRESQISYLNEGEGTILSYHDRSSWGQAATEVHTPHHSMSLPTEMARRSRGSIQISPQRKAQLRSSQLWQLNSAPRLSRQLSGIGHGRHDSQASHAQYTPEDPFASLDPAPQGLIEAFPTPSAEGVQARRSSSRYSRTTYDPNRMSTRIARSKSIRMVERSPTTGTCCSSVLRICDEEDERPLDIRRQSYIKRRAASRSPFFSTVAVGSSRSSRADSRTSSQSLQQDALHSNIERPSSFLFGDSNSVLGRAIENLRRQRTQKGRAVTHFPESSSSEHAEEARLGAGASGLPPSTLNRTANSSRQFESASSFYSSDSSIWGSDFNTSADITSVDARHRDQGLAIEASHGGSRKIERRHSGKRSAWAAKLGRDYNGEIGQAPPLSSPRNEQTQGNTPPPSNRVSLASSTRTSQLRRSRLAAETRAWRRRLPLSPLKDANAIFGSGNEPGGSSQQAEEEVSIGKGSSAIGLGLTTGGDWETIGNGPSESSSQRFGGDDTPVFL